MKPLFFSWAGVRAQRRRGRMKRARRKAAARFSRPEGSGNRFAATRARGFAATYGAWAGIAPSSVSFADTFPPRGRQGRIICRGGALPCITHPALVGIVTGVRAAGGVGPYAWLPLPFTIRPTPGVHCRRVTAGRVVPPYGG